MYFIYAIMSLKDHRVYVGYTEDIDRRIKEHNAGYTRSTRGNRPWVLAYIEEVKNLKEALRMEKYYKSGSGKEKLKKKIKMAL